MTLDQGRTEAEELIRNSQIWVYDVNGICATICAVTRTTYNVSSITKVYTTPKFRKMGGAEHLVRHVTRGYVGFLCLGISSGSPYFLNRLLFDTKRDVVMLYVSHGNSAQRVYDRVGFVGLCSKEQPEGVEDAVELGFVGAARGHW